MLKEYLDIIVSSWAWGNNMLKKKNTPFVKSSTGCKHSKQYSFYIHVWYDFRYQIQQKKRNTEIFTKKQQK